MMQYDAIPMLDLAAQHAEIEEELLEGFAEVLASGRFVLGEPVIAFEAELAKTCETRHAVSCNSGTDALWLALRGLGIGPGDAVLCPAYSFFATAATIVRLGARPVFVDIAPDSLNLDPQAAIARADACGAVRAAVTVDLFGRVCELGPLADWCAHNEVPIVEDAAQSIGAIDGGGRLVGGRARVACFSFYPTKNLGALGDAGGLVTSDPELARRIARLRVHGESEPGVYEELGVNSRLDALQAVALSIKLRHLERWTRARIQLAMLYDKLFAERGAQVAGSRSAHSSPSSASWEPADFPLETPMPVQSPGRHTYHRYVVRVPASRRARLIADLEHAGVASEVYYPRGLHQQPALAEFAGEDALVETERASRETLALPLYPELLPQQIERVVETVHASLTRD